MNLHEWRALSFEPERQAFSIPGKIRMPTQSTHFTRDKNNLDNIYTLEVGSKNIPANVYYPPLNKHRVVLLFYTPVGLCTVWSPLHDLWNVNVALLTVKKPSSETSWPDLRPRTVVKKRINWNISWSDDASLAFAIFRFSILRRFTISRVFNNYVLPEFFFFYF